MDNNFIVADNEKKEDAAGRLAQKLDALIKEAEKIDKENEILKEENERLKSINSELHEKIESLEKENRKLHENIEHLCRGIDELKKRFYDIYKKCSEFGNILSGF